MPLSPFAYGLPGATLVTTDGTELLVHDGDSEAPRWMRTLGAPIVGVANVGDSVVALAANGRLNVFSAGGEETSSRALDVLAVGLAASGDKVAVLGGASVQILPLAGGGDRVSVDIAEATSAAFDASGGALAIGTADGEIAIARVSDGVITGQVRAASKVAGLAYHARAKCFLASVGQSLMKVTPKDDAVVIEPIMTSDKLDWSALAISEDGSIAAGRVSDHRVMLVSLHDYKLVGQITFERQVGALEFGPDNFLGVALDRGDGNKIHLLTGHVHRTDPHDGRVRNSWFLIADVKTDLVAQALQKGRKATPLSRPSPYGAASEKAKKPSGEGKKKEKKQGGGEKPRAALPPAVSGESLFKTAGEDEEGKRRTYIIGGALLLVAIALLIMATR